MSSSGECVSFARLAPRRGTIPMPEASTSPLPRHASDAATMRSSAREKSFGGVIAKASASEDRHRQFAQPLGTTHFRDVVLFGDVHEFRRVSGPAVFLAGQRGV